MPSELEELIEFLHHGNTQIRQIATENLVPFSKTEPSIFKETGFRPIQDLKLLVKDYGPIAHDAISILINISDDHDILKNLIDDDEFSRTLLRRITNPKESNANEIAMLLANMAKSDSILRILSFEGESQPALSKSKRIIDQLMDCFVKGANGSYNPKANFDYLAYLFADLAKFTEGARYLIEVRPHDGVHPIAKLLPFLNHVERIPSRPPSSSAVRRLGVASALKNMSFSLPTHPVLLSAPVSALPFVLLPLASGADKYAESETDELPEELQLLEDSATREKDHAVLRTHLETLLLWTTTNAGREVMRQRGVYYVIRECHLAIEDEEVREGCDRLVQVLMRGEPKDAEKEMEERAGSGVEMLTKSSSRGQDEDRDYVQEIQEDEDDKIVEIY